VVQIVECLPSKCEVLSSNSGTAKKKKKTCELNKPLLLVKLVLGTSYSNKKQINTDVEENLSFQEYS
jgi:hypothetical protein